MTREEFKSWLDAYGRAWETLDANSAADLFAQDAAYHKTPFVEPMRGRAEILAYWSHIGRSQEQIRFGYEILAATNQDGIAHWWASFTRIAEGARVKLDGIFLITLNAEGRCTTLREWWQRKTIAPDQTVQLSPDVRHAIPLRRDSPDQ
jgi:SnoaL-like protein